MKPLLAVSVLVLTSLLFSPQVFAQPRADFTMDNTAGCSPLTVQFINTTQGASQNAIWEWNFGNGNSSTLKDASAIFTATGTYTITLTVTDGTQSATQTKTVTVYQKPVIDFTINPANGCTPLNTTFTASMTGGDGVITSYNWDFGDGSVQQTNTPVVTHLYNFKQTASVSLTATNNYGCATTLLKNDIVTVKDSVRAAFTVNKRTYCESSANVSFTNNSTGAGTLTYLWDFGDGQTSAAVSPTHNYSARGIYTVSLTVSSSEGCTVTREEKDYINVGSFFTDFEIPATTCENRQTIFKNTSTPHPTESLWFVNGSPVTPSSDTALDYLFPSAGTYAVRLVNNFDICQQEITKQVQIRTNPKIDSFLIDNPPFCSKPYTVTFTDTNSNAAARRWYFISWYNLHDTARIAKHDIYDEGTFSARLEIDDAWGCTASIIQYFRVEGHNLSIPYDNIGERGCDSFARKFEVVSNYPIKNYHWDFRDGYTSTEASPTHTFKGRGEKYVTFSYETENGCIGTFETFGAWIFEKPKADFTIDSVICGDTWVHLQNNYISGDLLFWMFDMGVGKGYGEFYHDFRYTEEGVYTVSMVVGNGICWDTVTKHNVVRVQGPWVRIQDIIYTCDGERNTVTFKDSSTACDKWTWDFGDGTTQSYTSYQPTVSHTFPKSFQYEVKLKGERNDGCTIEESVPVYVLTKQKPVITIEQPVCINQPVQVYVRELDINYYNFADFRPWYDIKKWEYYDGSPANVSFEHDLWSYSDDLDGKLTVKEVKNDSLRIIMTSAFYNCDDTTNWAPIVVKGVTTQFEVVSDSICFKSPVVLRDLSTSVGSNNIISWKWDFGDGRQLTTTQAGTVNHIYDSPGQYTVTLTASDAGGCTNSTTNQTRPVTVLGVKASFNVVPSTTVAVHNPLQFNNTSNTAFAGTVSWQWDFGDGHSSSEMNPVHAYTAEGTYTARLIATDHFSGCKDTATITITCGPEVTSFNINTAFIGDQSACPPVKAAFAYTSNLPADSIVWNFGDGFILNNQTHPSHIYTTPGEFIVTLQVYFQSVLMGTHKDTVHVAMPPAVIAADDLSGCIGDRISFYSPRADSGYNYTWDFGNGSVLTSADSTASHVYGQAGSFSPVLIVRNALGCASSVNLDNGIVIHPDPAITIMPATAVACKENGVQLQASGGVDYTWSPAAGLNSSTIASPIATPTANTVYTVQATDANGCTGSATTTVVLAEPVNLQALSSADICIGEKVQLNVAGAESYQWINNISGLNNSAISNPIASPDATTIYTIVGFDQYQCYSDTMDIVVNVRPSPTVQLGPDIEMPTGTPQILQSSGSADIVRWEWTPSNYLNCTNCAAPVCTPQSSIEYVLKVYNQYNCTAADTIKVTAICMDNVGIPNAFTPNNDGNNDVFGIPTQGVGKVIYLRVYNRWGEIVFEKKDFIPGNGVGTWNGKYKGIDAPSGIYVYTAEFECTAGVRTRQKGTVMLIR